MCSTVVKILRRYGIDIGAGGGINMCCLHYNNFWKESYILEGTCERGFRIICVGGGRRE